MDYEAAKKIKRHEKESEQIYNNVIGEVFRKRKEVKKISKQLESIRKKTKEILDSIIDIVTESDSIEIGGKLQLKDGKIVLEGTNLLAAIELILDDIKRDIIIKNCQKKKFQTKFENVLDKLLVNKNVIKLANRDKKFIECGESIPEEYRINKSENHYVGYIFQKSKLYNGRDIEIIGIEERTKKEALENIENYQSIMIGKIKPEKPDDSHEAVRNIYYSQKIMNILNRCERRVQFLIDKMKHINNYIHETFKNSLIAYNI